MNTPFQINVINQESMQESLSFPLTKKSLFISLSSIFVLIFLFFTTLIFFTPLKYYLPGYNVDNNRKQILKLQKSTDSLLLLNTKREAYIFNLIKVMQGDVPNGLDTNTLSEAKIRALQIQEEASIKSANAIRKTLPKPVVKNDSSEVVVGKDSVKK